MGINKIVHCGDVLLDLTSDTVVPNKLASGYTAHDKTGTLITGVMSSGYGITQNTLDNGNCSLTITGSGLDVTKTIEVVTFNGVEFQLTVPITAPNLFSLSTCTFERNILNYTPIGETGCTFTIKNGITNLDEDTVYFQLDPLKTYNLSWTAQNCKLSGYDSSWGVEIFHEIIANGQNTVSNVTNARNCFFYVADVSTSRTGTFQDVVITEV